MGPGGVGLVMIAEGVWPSLSHDRKKYTPVPRPLPMLYFVVVCVVVCVSTVTNFLGCVVHQGMSEELKVLGESLLPKLVMCDACGEKLRFIGKKVWLDSPSRAAYLATQLKRDL